MFALQNKSVVLEQQITKTLNMNSIPDSDGRELAWFSCKNKSTVDRIDDGDYAMHSIRFKTKDISCNFMRSFNDVVRCLAGNLRPSVMLLGSKNRGRIIRKAHKH